VSRREIGDEGWPEVSTANSSGSLRGAAREDGTIAMSSTWPKVIRDPIHGIVPFEDTPWDRLLLDLINTKEMQRLRRIKQLGMSHLVFPGADHSRFAHSIGVMHTARLFLDRVTIVLKVPLSEFQRTALLTAALIHDVGHGPFSHAFEKFTGENHERRTLEIIRDRSTEVNACLVKFDGSLPAQLESFFAEDVETPGALSPIPPFLTQIVSSQLDADRFDYLPRDSRATGTAYGIFDSAWLLQNLFLDQSKHRFFLGRKAVLQAEQYVFARYHMYQSVYFHKTTRAAEVMLRLMFRRYKVLLDAQPTLEAKQGVVPDAPDALVRAFAKQLTLSDYLDLDDHTMTEFFKACGRCADVTLQMLALGVLHRRLFKATDVTGFLAPGVAKFTEKAKAILGTAGIDPNYAFESDTPSDTAYKLYDPDAAKPATQIFVEVHDGSQKELSSVSENVRQLTRKYTLIRYYYPASVRSAIRAEAEPLLKE
jgi:uncharacterized protein